MAATTATLARIAALPVVVPTAPTPAPEVEDDIGTCQGCGEEKEIREFLEGNNDDTPDDFCHACVAADALLPCGCRLWCGVDHTSRDGPRNYYLSLPPGM